MTLLTKETLETLIAQRKEQYKNIDDTISAFNREIELSKEYNGRQILELIQNADDAKAKSIKIHLDKDKHILEFYNDGQPFSLEGIKSILIANLSSKISSSYIGNKGLGFRSILVWADSISIITDGLKINFSSTIALKTMQEIGLDVKKIRERQKLTEDCIPFPILGVPEVETIEKNEGCTVVVNYKPEYETNIQKQIQDIDGKTLLFLQFVDAIITDDKQLSIHKEGQWIEADGKKWLIKQREEILPDQFQDKNKREQKKYVVKMAIPVEESFTGQESYRLYNYLPTQETLTLPFILHATLDLKSDRNHINDCEVNRYILERAAELVRDYVLELLKTGPCDWKPYRFMSYLKESSSSLIQEHLLNKLEEMKRGMAIYPTIGGQYIKEEDYYFYNNEFGNFVKNHQGCQIFKNHLLPTEENLFNFKHDRSEKYHVNSYVEKLVCYENGKEERNLLARFIQLLVKIYHNQFGPTEKFNLLCDADGYVIQSTESAETTAYINTGERVNDIPKFCRIKYVDTKLQVALRKWDILKNEKEPDRKIASLLNKLTSVVSTDVTSIKKLLISQLKKECLQDSEREQLLICLYKLFVNQNKTDQFVPQDSVVYLPNEEGDWVEAKNLVLVDARFPNGLSKLNIQETYAPENSAKFPTFILHNQEIDPTGLIDEYDTIQHFYMELGAHLYFKTINTRFINDENYLSSVNKEQLTPEIRNKLCWESDGKTNYCRIPDLEFLGKLPLQDLLKVVSQSDYNRQICQDQTISWYYHYERTIHVSQNYIAFVLRKLDNLKALEYYILDDKDWLTGYKPNNNKTLVIENFPPQLLEKLGAKRSLANFTPEKLYESLDKAGFIYLNKKGVQSLYHVYKTILDEKNASLPEHTTLHMLCTRNGETQLIDSKSIFYADNNELPKEILSKLPMLKMDRREGNEKVSKIFGCRSIKELQVQVVGEELINKQVNFELNKKLECIKPYILAFASLGGAKSLNKDNQPNPTTINLLDKFYVNVVESLSYTYTLDKKNLLIESHMQLQDGELLCCNTSNGIKFYVCSKELNLSRAMAKPAFINSIVEAICIRLRLSSREITNSFYRIVTSNEPNLKYYKDTEINEQLWNNCKDQFGISNEDIEFWRNVFTENKINFDENKFKLERTEYLHNCLHIDRERLHVENFKIYHVQQLELAKSKYDTAYELKIYDELKDCREKHTEYLDRTNHIVQGDWYKSILEKENKVYLLTLDYDMLIKETIKSKFKLDLKPEKGQKAPSELPEYEGIHLPFGTENKWRSLLFFSGHKKELEEICKTNQQLDTDSGENIEPALQPVPIEEIKLKKEFEDYPPKTGNGSRETPKPHGRNSRKYEKNEEAGRRAEKKVFESLSKEDSGYEVHPKHIYSNMLNPGHGDDRKGYDLEYRKKGEILYRCLEIKNCSDGKSVIVSANEYETSRKEENRNRYDMALYINNKVKIIRNVFKDIQPNSDKLKPNDYTFYFEIEDTTDDKQEN